MFFRILTLAAGILCAALAPTFVSAAEQQAATTVASAPDYSGSWRGTYSNTCWSMYSPRSIWMEVPTVEKGTSVTVKMSTSQNWMTRMEIKQDGVTLNVDYVRAHWTGNDRRLETYYEYFYNESSKGAPCQVRAWLEKRTS